jgi:hypothetical protein
MEYRVKRPFRRQSASNSLNISSGCSVDVALYSNVEVMESGPLSYAFACRRPVTSTDVHSQFLVKIRQELRLDNHGLNTDILAPKTFSPQSKGRTPIPTSRSPSVNAPIASVVCPVQIRLKLKLIMYRTWRCRLPHIG